MASDDDEVQDIAEQDVAGEETESAEFKTEKDTTDAKAKKPSAESQEAE